MPLDVHKSLNCFDLNSRAPSETKVPSNQLLNSRFHNQWLLFPHWVYKIVRSQFISFRKKILPSVNVLQYFQYFPHLIWTIYGVCTLALTVEKTNSHNDRFAISVFARSLLLFDLALQDGEIGGPKGPRGTRGNRGISDGQKLCYLKTLGIRQNCPYTFRQIQKDDLSKKNRQIVLHIRQNVPNP